MLDIAAGHGIFGITIAQRNPQATVVAVDWPRVLTVATENAVALGVAARHTTVPGDAFTVDWGTGYDVALVTNFLHHFDIATCTAFLGKVHNALNKGGRVVVLEFVPNEDRVSPSFPAAFALSMLAETGSGDAYTMAELKSMSEAAGFHGVTRHDLRPAHRHRRDTLIRGGPEQVVAYVRGLIESGALHAGDRLPTERELAAHLGVSRPTVRAGLRVLATLAVVRSRRGSGTFITDGPPVLGSEPLSFLAALHGFTRDEMYEVRRILEVGAAGLAAERATGDHVASLADEVAGMFASLDHPQVFLNHDIRFHRAVGIASGNPIVASLAGWCRGCPRASARIGHQRVRQGHEGSGGGHRRIYQAIRARDGKAAREAMNEHLLTAQAFRPPKRRRATTRRRA